MFAALLITSAVIPGKAEMYKFGPDDNKGQRAVTAAGCTPSSAFEWLDINNVKTRVNAGGDMWWDLPAGTGSKYYIPASGSATSLFAGSLWIAGVDVNDQLKCAAVRFRQGPNGQGGNDFWTGPLSVEGKASIDDATCARWDKLFKITRAEVDEFLNACDPVTHMPRSDYQIPTIIKNWPAHPMDDDPEGIAHYLAPFYDADGNGEYDPSMGDYPYYDIENELCHTKIPTMEEEVYGTMHGSILADQVLKGDQTLWWIFNDKGASHTESGGQAIGIEVRAQAFAFATNDEINNMTFYSYEIINRSTYTLTGTYFSPWTDVDLGYGWDDYVGCDVGRGLGYGYNGKAVDGSGEPEAYGSQPPAIGIDFFQGPYMDADGIDNPKYQYVYQQQIVGSDTIMVAVDSTQMVDESINGVNFGNGIIDDERFGMRRFVYHNNSSTDNGDPKTAPQYYNYLRGIWKNGAKMRYGGNAFTGNDVVGPECDFMFPGDSDPWNWGTGGMWPEAGYNTNGKYWSEEQCQNAPNDRRFMQSAGPFTLEPGAVNYITFGVPWARATSGGAWASVELLRVVDDKCQALFDNCFKVIDGPNAPDLTIRELDQQLIIYLSNTAISNNYKEGYAELDPEIPTSYFEAVDTYDTIHCTLENGHDTTILIVNGHDNIEHPYDRYYRFEGYKVYQLANAEVGSDELYNTDKARLVFQCDVRNGVTRLMNYEYDESLQANVPRLKVEGGDAGITHSFVITEDKFASGDNPNLVNHQTYYYMAVAYSYNNYLTYSQEDVLGLQGQKKPYLEGRKNIQCYSAVPHKIVNGTVLRATYGDSPAVTRLVGVGNGGNELELDEATVNSILFDEQGNVKMANDSTCRFGNPNYPIAYHPTYEPGFGPINVKIVDPLNVKSHRYELSFDEMFEQYTANVTGNPEIRGDSAARMVCHWNLLDLDEERSADNPCKSDTTTVYQNEQMFIDRGISITIAQPYDIGRIWVGEYYDVPTGGVDGPEHEENWHDSYAVVAPNNGVITSSIEFQDPTSAWLDGIRDIDIADSYLNWIRSGQYSSADNAADNDYDCSADTGGNSEPWDPTENYEKIALRTWAPSMLTSFWKQGNVDNPGPLFAAGSRNPNSFKETASIDVVFTSDTTKWSRCPVLEMCVDKTLSEGGADRFYIRKHASINPAGKTCEDLGIEPDLTDPNNPAYIAEQGMGWFPGYAIDVETGARLNIAYGEDSYLEDMGGRDMMFNPAKLQPATVEQLYGEESQLYDPALFRGTDSEPVLGGKHFVYVWRMDSIKMISSSPYHNIKNFGYDGGQLLYNTLNFTQNMTNSGAAKNILVNFYKMVQWIGMPMGIEGMEWLPKDNECRIRIRIAKPYAPGYGYDLQTANEDLMINDLNPQYQFTIEGWDPVLNDEVKTDEDLNLVTVVPNPYYAYDTYEGNALTNRVKICNLPEKCVVSIYTISGTKVRQFRKDNDSPNIDWDLTNFANTPVASGFYLIHIKDLTSGKERVIKFFGAMRQVDLNTF